MPDKKLKYQKEGKTEEEASASSYFPSSKMGQNAPEIVRTASTVPPGLSIVSKGSLHKKKLQLSYYIGLLLQI